jgi:agmatinase
MLRREARKVINFLERGGDVDKNARMGARIGRINKGCEELNAKVYAQTSEWLDRGKLVGLVGGDHSAALGYIVALSECYESFGILHIDAHCDLRVPSEDIQYSHASIMRSVLNELSGISRLVQVGVRDFSEEELSYAASDSRIVQFADSQMADRMFEGETWSALCDRIVEALPQNVYVSFDIEGLTPDNCPHAEAPVAGGLSFNEAAYLLRRVVDNGRRIIGFDLSEVVPAGENSIDAGVGARMLFKLCGQTLRSNGENIIER